MRWLSPKKQPQLLSPLEGYNRWAASYSTESNPIKNLSDQLVEKFLPDLKHKSVLDFGCGTGKFCALAERMQAQSIHGIDLSPAMIEEAKKHTTKTTFYCGKIEEANLSANSFDVLIAALVMGHIENLDVCLGELLKSLKPGGVAILTDFHPFLTLSQSKRTFVDANDKKSYEVKHHLHLFEDYFRIFSKAECQVEEFEEPKFNNVPVIFGLKVVKK